MREIGKPLLDGIRTGGRLPPPIWLMRQAGRYLPEYRELRKRARDFLTFCYTPELAVEATLQPVRRFGLDAAIVFSDILVVPDALGWAVEFVSGEGPVVERLEMTSGLPMFDSTDFRMHLEPVFETVRQVRRAVAPRVTVIGFAGAPWTVATYMIEGGSSRTFASVKAWAFGEPESFDKVIALLTEATVVHLMGQIEAGAEAVQLFDSWAGVIPEAEFRRWVIAPTRVVVERIRQAYPEVPVIGFPRAAGVLYKAYVEETGVDAVGLDSSIPSDWAARDLQTRVAVQGNLDPCLLLVGGEVMRRAAMAIIRTLGSGRFVFNLGHGILPETPLANVVELVDTVHAAMSAEG
ncbi:MAG: uroporphyrinogen decarboxylase [Proteobacteria bacterium]|nr:uroporphyrinogen decarboxylase [Pseudomonadota bacterium]